MREDEIGGSCSTCNIYKVVDGEPQGKRPRRRWEDNIRIDLSETEYEGVYWINLTQDRVQ
jgi:hypothetical protein